MKTKTTEFLKIEVPKQLLKKAIQSHKKFALQGKDVDSSPLSAIQFVINDNELELLTSDGNRALISNIEILASEGDVSGQNFLLSMEQVSKLVLKKDKVLNSVAILKKGDFVEFYDLAYETTQTLKTRKLKPLNIKKAVPVDNSYHVMIAPYQIKALASIKADDVLNFYFDINKPSRAILIKSSIETLEQQAVIMPCAREVQEE